ncbi:hypothetical protein [Pontiella sulfatireligans]|uniref:Uncharacterized protein n=1 Tax=Pontiella sulfatireligans TaxID=2750658 RepID=A0A6C2UE19_9BACT|nr:hypothetical protein [Pontiella sulfatireligans]VGO18395.1 hypothetical protein SCARR_00447 [Pontiella sulfatireligans]
MNMKWIAAAICLCGELGMVSSGAVPAGNRDYSFIYFEQGYPTRLIGRRAESMANRTARANPDVVVQTGFYSLRLDCDTMRLSGYDAVQGSDYVTALNEDMTAFTAADLQLRIEKDGIAYTCTSGVVQDPEGQNMRLIQSGQFVQRFDHVGLVFTGANGEVLTKAGRLEITAWPEHVVFNLDLSGVVGVTKTGIQLTSPAGKIHRSVMMGTRTVLTLQPHLDQAFQSLEPSSHIKVHDSLQVDFDPIEQGLRIKLPMERVRFPADTNRLDEFVVELRNPSGSDRSIPLIFDEIQTRGITGTSMLLCEERDGRPTGIPVQISKNWHSKPGRKIVHDGPWLRGYTMVPLKAGETKRFRLRVVTGYWGKVPAVSYAQLSVIGYGGNWKWDESALGSWGESMCYDPSQHLGSSFITDVRPAFTTGNGEKSYEWTENVGGGDFLVYFDRSNTYRWTKRLKTAYRWTGPNMSEVLYSGVTDDDAIRFNYRIRSVRTADYHRRFHSYRYEFLKDVASPKRLVFHQMAADYYNSVQFDRFYLGGRHGLEAEYDCPTGTSGYTGTTVPFENRWLAIDDTTSSDRKRKTAKTRRGLLSIGSKLNDKPFPAYLHLHGVKGTGSATFDLSSDSVSRSYSAGDVVEGELEFILPPKTPDVYWGTDREFSGRLKSYGTNAWQAVADEFDHNIQLGVSVRSGRLERNYPVEIQALESGKVLADFTIERGGIGHVPILLRDVPLGCALKAERHLDGKWVPLESVEIDQNNYYQGVRNSDGTMDCVFNIKRPSHDLDDRWRVRILK